MGTGYTRNDTSNNIANGNVIDAADLDGEFDAIATAFGTSGHSHDGTTAEGGAIVVVGPTQEFLGDGSSFYPKTDATYDLGKSTASFDVAYVENINLAGTGITATGAELNYTDGVTSNIQTQLGTKLPLAGGTMTGAIDMGSNNITTTGKVLFANMYSTEGDLPSATTYHGMFAHVHATGAGYFAHGGSWVKLANDSQISDENFTTADHSKLDGIETGATADQTKADVEGLGISFSSLSAKPTTVSGYGITDASTTTQMNSAISTAIGNLIDSAPTALDTLNEIAASLGDDADFAGSMTTNLASKLPLSGGTMTGNISHASNFTLDVAGEINLDADGGSVFFKDAGTEFFKIRNTGSDVQIYSARSDADIKFEGVDGGVGITALTLDMSDAGTASFNHDIKLPDGGKALFGASSDLQIFHNGTHSYISDSGTGYLILKGSVVEIKGSNDEVCASFSENGATQLYYDNAVKLATTSTGIDVTGTINGGDCRGEIWYMGRDTNDFIGVETTQINFILDGATDMRLENDGDLHVEGNVIAYSTTISDERLKKDIVKIDNALDKISQLNGYTFEYIADGKKSAGVIAQEVEKVMPSAVSETTLPLKMGEDDKTEYKTVQYDQLHGLMIEAIKELKAEIEVLKGK